MIPSCAEHGEMMFNQVSIIMPIPRETASSARAIFGRKNFYILAGENLESVIEHIKPEHLLEVDVMLSQITLFQFLEGLTDAQAIDAVRTRLDWKFALHLPIYPPTVQENALCEFRQMILIDPVCRREFQRLIDRFATFDAAINNQLQDFKGLELVSSVCSNNSLGLTYEAMRRAMEVLACRFPMWLRTIALPHWYGRYSHTAPGFDTAASPYQQAISTQEINLDIHHLLEEVRCSSFSEIEELEEIDTLDFIGKQQFDKSEQRHNDQSRSLKLNDCDSCIHKERRDSSRNYQ